MYKSWSEIKGRVIRIELVKELGPRLSGRLFSWTLKFEDGCKSWDEEDTGEPGAEVLNSCVRADVPTLASH